MGVIAISGGYREIIRPIDQITEAVVVGGGCREVELPDQLAQEVNDFMDDFWKWMAEVDRKARAWREQRITALADQLPPKALTMRRIMPRARRNLPAGIRFRGVRPNAKAAD